MDGELTGQEMLLLRRHLDGCKACSTELVDIRNVKISISELTPAIPRDEFFGNIIESLDHTASSPGELSYLWDMHRFKLINGFAKAGLAVALCSLMFLGFNFVRSGAGSSNIRYTGSQNMAMIESNSGKIVGMLDVQDEPYSISNNKPLPVISNKTPYSYCRSQCESRATRANVPAAVEENPYIEPHIVVTGNALYQ